MDKHRYLENAVVAGERTPVSLKEMWCVWVLAPGSALVSVTLSWMGVPLFDDVLPIMGLLLAATHAIGGIATLTLLLQSGSHHRRPELYVLIAYWLGLAGSLLGGLLGASSRPTAALVLTRVAVVSGVLLGAYRIAVLVVTGLRSARGVETRLAGRAVAWDASGVPAGLSVVR